MSIVIAELYTLSLTSEGFCKCNIDEMKTRYATLGPTEEKGSK